MGVRQCVILAGGKGTRMLPLTQDLPKALLPVRRGDESQPFLHYQLELLAEQGFTDILLSIGFEGDQIRRFAGRGEQWNLKIDYVDEGSELRGTGGALRLALDEGKLQPTFAVLYGDSYLPISLAEVWDSFAASDRLVLMTVLRNEGKWDQSNVEFDGKFVTRYQKNAPPEIRKTMDYIDYGFSVFKRAALEKFISGYLGAGQTKFDLADLFHQMSLASQVVGFETASRFYEIGSPQGLRDLETFFHT